MRLRGAEKRLPIPQRPPAKEGSDTASKSHLGLEKGGGEGGGGGQGGEGTVRRRKEEAEGRTEENPSGELGEGAEKG
eukprot:749858-Hanusia_phi.AAC.7